MRHPIRISAASLIAFFALTGSAHALVISELRVRGPNGANDEFVELQNETGAPITVQTSDGSAGWAVTTSSGVRFVVPNGTTIPPLGTYLGANSVAFPAVIPRDATWTTDIPDNAGVAVFNTATPANFNTATRLDAVGSASEANALYREGAGYNTLTPFSIDYAFYRDLRAGGIPKDTGNNALDLVFVDTNGTSAGAGQRLGAPSPESSTAPFSTTTPTLDVTLLDPSVPATAAPNTVIDPTAAPAANATFGRLTNRWRVRNAGTSALTSLQLKIADLTTFPSPAGISDLRPQTSAGATVSTASGAVDVLGTTLVQPPTQPNGGGFGSVLRVPLASPLAPGGSVAVQVVSGIQQNGVYRLCLHAAGTPGAGGTFSALGTTTSGATPAPQCWAAPGSLPTAPPTVAPVTTTVTVPQTVTTPAPPPVVQTVTKEVDVPRTAPKVGLALGSGSSARSVSIRVSCPAGTRGFCAGTVSATAKASKKAVRLGSTPFVVPATRSQTLVLKPSAKARKALARTKRAAVSITATAFGDGSVRKTSTASGKFRR
ncbi:lamin tail domain-containing protein [Patulibacter minatonensis]|uniref:lamin tail domain-containing protein n=1 Tax=Patulibacter minatonensis TaxID=298163 RepID=UPI00047A5411|nr:lamin tail domain-containing protein [Patulibacter minatonensis]